MSLPWLIFVTRASAIILLAELPVHKNNTLKVFMILRIQMSFYTTIRKNYFTRIKNQMTDAFTRLKKTAALPISLALLASL